MNEEAYHDGSSTDLWIRSDIQNFWWEAQMYGIWQQDHICPTPTYQFLGVIVDQELRWNAQVDHTIVKGMAYVLQLCRLSSTAKGLSLWLMCQLYQAVALLKMLYAADLWFTPSFQEGSVELQWGSVGMAKWLTSVQCTAALAITRAMLKAWRLTAVCTINL
jgi:hypothetical protein